MYDLYFTIGEQPLLLKPHSEDMELVMEALMPLSGFRPESVFHHLDLPDSTIRDYRCYLNQFIQFVEESGFDRDTFLNYKRWLDQNYEYTVSTKNKYLTVARIFLKELHRQGVVLTDPTANIKSFKQSRLHKKEGLTDDELAKLVEHLQELHDTPSNHRTRCIIGLLLFQGLRQIEVVRLDYEDIDLAHKTMFIHGKGRDDNELVDLHPKTVGLLRRS